MYPQALAQYNINILKCKSAIIIEIIYTDGHIILPLIIFKGKTY